MKILKVKWLDQSYTLGRLFQLQCKEWGRQWGEEVEKGQDKSEDDQVETAEAAQLRENEGLNQAAAIGVMHRMECQLTEVGGKAEGK